MTGEYADDELLRLHGVLYDILSEIARVCDLLHIPYFIQGGSAIGAFFEQAILPWDDDIDVGLTRENYDRFQREAPALLRPEFVLQNQETDPHTPYFFSKLMKRGTVFEEYDMRTIPMMKGIFVDVFPYDKVPDNPRLQKFQRTVAQFFNCCLMGTEQWRWKHFGTCQIAHPTNRGLLPCLLTRIAVTLLSKRQINRMLVWSQTWFNRKKTGCSYYNMVLFPKDHISVESIENPQRVPFGPLTVWAPSNLEAYLRHHYRNLRRHIPKEEQQNHHPYRLCFDSGKGSNIPEQQDLC